MPNTTIPKSYDKKFGGQSQSPSDQALQNAQLAEVAALAHSHSNKALLDSYDQTNVNLADAVVKKHNAATAKAGSPLSVVGQEFDFLFDDLYLQMASNKLSVKTGSFALGTNTTGVTVTGTGKTVGSDITLNLPQRIDTAATVRYENISVGGAYDTLYKHKVYGNANVTGNLNVDGDVLIGGNLTVAGDSVTFTVGTMVVEDKTIEFGKVATPTDTTANGGGLILKGSTDKSWLWDSTNANWTSSEHVNVASGKSYKVNNNVVIDSSRVGILTKLNVNGPATVAEALNLNGNAKVWGNIISSNSSVVDPYAGYFIGQDGSVFNRISASELHVKNFIADYQLALLGGLRIVKSSAKLAADLTISGGTGTLVIEEIPGSSGFLFEANDYIIIRIESNTGTAFNVTLIGGTVNAGTRNDTNKMQSYTLTKLYGSGTSALKGSVALDYGKAGDGIIELVARDEFGRTTIRIADFQTNPWTDLTVKTQLGNLSGLTTYLWGALSGYGLYTNKAYLDDDIFIADTAIIGGRQIGMLNGMTALFHFDNNLYDCISGANASYSGTLSETAYGLLTATNLVCTKTPGKFGGAIAIEEATTNTGVNVTFTDATGWTNYTANSGAGIRTFGKNINSFKASTCLNLIKNDGGSGNFGVYQANANWTSVQHTFTVYFRVNSYTSGAFLYLAHASTTIAAINLSTVALGEWVRIQGTTSGANPNRYIYLAGANADVDVTCFQAEAKAYSTSFTNVVRAAGKLIYPANINSQFTIQSRVYIDINRMQSGGVIFDYALDANNRLYVDKFPSSNLLQFALVTGGVTRMNETGYSLSSLTAGWHLLTITYDGVNYKLYIDESLIYYPASSNTLGSNWNLFLGTNYSGSAFSNSYYDELAIFNRALSLKEIQQIYYSNQAFNESAGITVISGNQIKTGFIQSENWESLTKGMLIDLNKGRIEINNGVGNVGNIDASTGVLAWAGWNLDVNEFKKITGDKAIYLHSSETGLTGLQIDLKYGGSAPAGAAKWLSVGKIRRGGSGITDNYGFAITDQNGNQFFEASVSNAGLPTMKVASFLFDTNVMRLPQTINGTEYDILKLGDFEGDPPDISTDITSTIFANGEAKFDSLAAYNAWTEDPSSASNLQWSSSIYYGASGGSAQYNGYSGTSTTSAGGYWYIEKDASAVAGKTVEISLRVRWGSLTTNPSQQLAASLVIYKRVTGIIPAIPIAGFRCSYPGANGVWTLYTFTLAVPADANSLLCYIRLINTTSGNSQPVWNSMNVDDLTIKVYSTTQTWMNKTGFQIYSSPLSYLKIKYGKMEISAETLLINGYKVASFAGSMTEAPANPRGGMMYFNNLTSKMNVYVEDSVIGAGAWYSWTVA